jgi:release factor H-coupled RctB family protein
VDVHRDGGLKTDSKDSYEVSKRYLKAHDNCLKWAQASRELIAHRFLEQLGSGYHRIVDRIHNSITIVEGIKRNFYLHRKGVSPLVTYDEPFYYHDYPISPASRLVIIPGSRGTPSYLVRPHIQLEETYCYRSSDYLYSVAHGAGRKWSRSECEGRLRDKYSADSMKKTKLGSYVICEDKELLYEEAPQAYKDIESVIGDMVSFGLISVVAVFEPVLTYKVRQR